MSDFDFKRAAYTPKETMEILSIGRTSLYSAVKSGRLKITKPGGKPVSNQRNHGSRVVSTGVLQHIQG